MTRKRISWLVAIPVVVLGCGSGSGGKQSATGGDGGSLADAETTTDGATTGDAEAGAPTGDNVAPLIVDDGPPGTASADVPFVSVTICIPGTTTCQTIDHVSVDTGSSGLRIISSVLKSNIALPQQTATTGSSLAECYQYVDGYTWGSIRLADVKLAGEVASKIPVHIIGDPAFASVPTDCSSSGSAEDTVVDFGANGIIGVNQIVPDCGSYCAAQNPVQTGSYYSCTGGACTAVAVAVANQVSNPIAFFAKDNNGAVLQFPMVAAAGAPTLAGSMIFGIGTAANNGLGSATVLTVDESGNFTTVFNGQTLNTSYIDSGTSTLSFNDAAIPQCTANDTSGFFCPTSTVSLTAQNKGLNGVTSSVSFSVANTDSLFGNASYTAFDDLGSPYGSSDNTTFAWGFPFFIGRSVYVAVDGAATPGGKGPYFAY
jgi:hypothetical protein